ncbi:replicative DNA helicase [Candidatus Bandiella numerosa]|jgi:replicative DNA helicase|uniref:replicative DNA helicase n=1 Tax=Candidatus Bandiella numerosa TaxID=2570586 RepID=UPI00249E3B06|nr:replicative DNA helicase [Candidatus Bandiella numerosa]WHA05158.1 replicative DNA helicase [Candidatus Bandiella numerosa]
MKGKDKEKNIETRPHNIEAEQNLLGLLLNNNENMNKIGDVLREEHFYLPLHAKIYQGIGKLMDKGLVSDPITIKNYFAKEEIFKDAQINSYEYLLKLVEESQLSTDIRTLARNIYDTYLRRKIIDIGEEGILKAKEEKIEEGGENIIEAMEHELYTLASSGNYDNKVYSLTDSIKGALVKIEKLLKSKREISGIETGYIDLNKYTGGFQSSDLIIIAGRPSMGKTALAVNIMIRAAKYFVKESKEQDTKKKSICFFSLEMSAEQLASRILAIETKIDGSKIRIGKVNKGEFKNLSEQISILNELPIIIDDTPALTISAIRTKARRMKRQHNIGLLVIDYLQLINSTGRNKENRVQEIAEISQGLKAIAKELDIPVITASQLSRAVESREDKRPLLSDLRESGNIEQDADIVMFIYREEYYLSRKIPSTDEKKLIEWQEKMEKVENIAEIIIAKQRNGPVGNFHLRYDNKTTAFDNLEN